MPSKTTGPQRQKRYLAGIKEQGWVRVSVIVPEQRREHLNALAAEWRFKDPRPRDYSDDAPSLPGIDGSADHD